MATKRTADSTVARNRKARHEFFIEDTFEAGLVLTGTEVKSLRTSGASIEEAYARPTGDELFLIDMHIAPYEQGNIMNHEPKRPRKLLLHRREMERIITQCTQRGFTVIPLRVYFKNGFAKVEIGLARRKKVWDKRRNLEAEQRREDVQRAMRHRR